MIEIGKYLYHMTHVNNLTGIMDYGILSDALLRQYGIEIDDISDPEVQRWRNEREPIFKRSIHEYAPLYINPKNPMLYRRKDIQHEIVILAVYEDVLKANKQHVFTDGNAASKATLFSSNIDILKNSAKVLFAEYWTDYKDGKRRRCAEVLVYPRVETEFIEHIVCFNENAQIQAQRETDITAIVDKDFYF